MFAPGGPDRARRLSIGPSTERVFEALPGELQEKRDHMQHIMKEKEAHQQSIYDQVCLPTTLGIYIDSTDHHNHSSIPRRTP